MKIMVFLHGTAIMHSSAAGKTREERVELTYPHIRPELKAKIKSIVVEGFGGIDHLPVDICALKGYGI